LVNDGVVMAVFVATYVGIAVGRVPGLHVDRAWIALSGAVILMVSGVVPLAAAGSAIDWPAMLLLFALMVVSAEFLFSGVYDRIGARLASLGDRPLRLLAAVVALGGGLSALLVNDIVAFALAPLLCAQLMARGLDPRPHLLALACACNAGSAATLVGNPQNILIGQAGGLGFWQYTGVAVVPAVAALLVTYAVVALTWRGRWQLAGKSAESAARPAGDPGSRQAGPAETTQGRRFKPWLAVVALLVLFATPLPREWSALAVAMLLMASRARASRNYIAEVDWNLLLLFVGLFIVTGALAALPQATEVSASLAHSGWLPHGLGSIAAASLLASNVIGNVPFVILLLQAWDAPTVAQMQALAVLSTLAGNLLIVGSVVNLIVAESARRSGVHIGFVAFARVGVPVTLLSMALAVGWLHWLLPA
jgi:Na+/H+ antiporter NhaD/arsenite permease-like protein